jgi:hypothetical protein
MSTIRNQLLRGCLVLMKDPKAPQKQQQQQPQPKSEAQQEADETEDAGRIKSALRQVGEGK